MNDNWQALPTVHEYVTFIAHTHGDNYQSTTWVSFLVFERLMDIHKIQYYLSMTYPVLVPMLNRNGRWLDHGGHILIIIIVIIILTITITTMIIVYIIMLIKLFQTGFFFLRFQNFSVAIHVLYNKKQIFKTISSVMTNPSDAVSLPPKLG